MVTRNVARMQAADCERGSLFSGTHRVSRIEAAGGGTSGHLTLIGTVQAWARDPCLGRVNRNENASQENEEP